VRNKVIGLAALAVVLLIGLSPLAADPVIHRGVDVFTTTASGDTFYDFGNNPIPAGFFCKRSAAFTGRIALRGVPLATEVPGQLHGADTVIERLDDAAFDDSGVAVTRLRFKALSLASIAPIKTACGSFHVYVSLAAKQRTTSMRINRTSEQGGNFVAPLAVDARMSFVPTRPRAASAPKLELEGSFTFPAKALPWMHEPGWHVKRLSSAVVDTNGDLTPDTRIFGTANFAPGWSPNIIVPKSCFMCEPASCHTVNEEGEQHCTGPIYACNGSYCP
jgi:hypothetical protein